MSKITCYTNHINKVDECGTKLFSYIYNPKAKKAILYSGRFTESLHFGTKDISGKLESIVGPKYMGGKEIEIDEEIFNELYEKTKKLNKSETKVKELWLNIFRK
ncbi:hypothetical protein HOD29_04390 [archaeon]|jgi:hypothetical protein|nr:hypothetical protein [archaeon]